MKKFFGIILLAATVYGCTANPTASNPTVTQTLTLSSSSNTVQVSGTIYDISSPATFTFPTSGNTTGLPYSFNFTTGKHDTVDFKVSFTPPASTSFNYYISSASVTTVQTAVTTDTNGNYTSPEITF